MGQSESFVDNYIRQYGVEGLSKLILLKKKISWLQESCTRQITRKVDDQIKYILHQIDELVIEEKATILQSYTETKSELVLISPFKVKKIQQKNARLLQNIYGKNQILDKLNSIKIEFHIQVHQNKKKVKKLIQQKISNIENHLLYQNSDIPISKHTIDNLFQQQNKQFDHLLEDPSFKKKLQEFKNTTIRSLNFQHIFWPNFDKKIRQNQLEIQNIHNEAEKNLKKMKADVRYG